MIHPYYKKPSIFQHFGKLHVIAGALTFLIDFSLFFLLFNILSYGLLMATIFAYIGSLIANFLLNRFWVFRNEASAQRFRTSIWRYWSLLLLNLVTTYLVLWVLETWFSLTPLLGKFVVWFFMIFWIYTANKFWLIKGPRKVKKFYFSK